MSAVSPVVFVFLCLWLGSLSPLAPCATYWIVNFLDMACSYQEPDGQFVLAVALFSYSFQEVLAAKPNPRTMVVEVVCKWRWVDSGEASTWEVLTFTLNCFIDLFVQHERFLW